MTLKSSAWIGFALGLPFARFGFAALPNKYKSWGGSGIDCDGPIGVMIVCVPAFLLYLAVGVAFVVLVIRKQGRFSAVGMVLCFVLLFGLSQHLLAALHETRLEGYQQTCG